MCVPLPVLECVHVCVHVYMCIFWIERVLSSFHHVLTTVWSSGKFNDPVCQHSLHQSQLSKERVLGIFHLTLQIDPLSVLPHPDPGPGQLACRDHLHWLLVDPCQDQPMGEQWKDIRGRKEGSSKYPPLSPALADYSLPLAVTGPIRWPCCHSSLSDFLTPSGLGVITKPSYVYELPFIFSGVLVKGLELIGALQNHNLIYNPLFNFEIILLQQS